MNITREAFALLALLVTAAIIAMFIARPQIIRDIFGGFSQSLGVAISPVTGASNYGNFGSGMRAF